MADLSDMRQLAFRRAKVWFWALLILGAVMPVAWLISILLADPSDFIRGMKEIGDWYDGLIILEAFTVVPYLIHALIARHFIRSNWQKPSQALFMVWGGTIGITIPIGGFWLMAIIANFTMEGGLGQGALILIFAGPIGIFSALVGYVLGYAAGDLYIARNP